MAVEGAATSPPSTGDLVTGVVGARSGRITMAVIGQWIFSDQRRQEVITNAEIMLAGYNARLFSFDVNIDPGSITLTPRITLGISALNPGWLGFMPWLQHVGAHEALERVFEGKIEAMVEL